MLFLRNAGGLCLVQLSAGDGSKIQGMISKKEIGADSLKHLVAAIEGERGTNQILVSEIAYLHGDGSLHVGKYMISITASTWDESVDVSREHKGLWLNLDSKLNSNGINLQNVSIHGGILPDNDTSD